MPSVAFSKLKRVSVTTYLSSSFCILCSYTHCFSFVLCDCFVAEKGTLEKCVKELEESLATRNAEAEKVAKDAAAREEQFVNRVAFLTQNVRGKFLICFIIYSTVHRIMLILLYVLILCRGGSSSSACGFVG